MSNVNQVAFAISSEIQGLNFEEIEYVNGGWRWQMLRTAAASFGGSWLYDNGGKFLNASAKTPLPNMGFH